MLPLLCIGQHTDIWGGCHVMCLQLAVSAREAELERVRADVARKLSKGVLCCKA